MPPIDDRCERLKQVVSFDRRARKACDIETDRCVEERMSQHAESHDQAEEHCWYRPLSIDPRFVGPCPQYVEELESNPSAIGETLLQKLYVRALFAQLGEHKNRIEWFKRIETEANIRNILSTDPDNPIALDILLSSILISDDYVEWLDLSLKERELDLDCPEWAWMFPDFTFRKTNVITDNWLAGEGSGSELTKEEIRDLFLRVQNTLLDVYDIAIEQNDGAQKLTWALESVYDAILTRAFENFQQIASRVEIGLEDYAEKRRAALIQKFSSEYDVDSDHGRSKSLAFVCSSHGFELGLLDHCVKLLSHFGLADSNLLDSPAFDWTRASISLLIGLTLDCSDRADFLLDGPSFWNGQGQCLEDHHAELISIIRELLDRFSEFEESAEREVLEAYLRLDETSGERFRRALVLDDSVIVYASRLIKRLHRLGKVETATNILTGIDTENVSGLDQSEERLLKNVTNSVNGGQYRNWSESSWGFLPDSYSRADNP